MPNPTGKNQYSGGRGRKKKKTSPRVQSISASGKVGSVSLTDAAAKMVGTGSKQHKAAIKRFGK